MKEQKLGFLGGKNETALRDSCSNATEEREQDQEEEDEG